MGADMRVSPQALDKISSIIYKKAGLFLQRRDKDKIVRFLEGELKKGTIKSVDSFIKSLETSQNQMNKLLDVVTINETYFFRHKSHFDVMEKELLPKLFKEKASVKMWSAACSTGEEPYTMAIVALEVMERLKTKRSVQIIANDISQEALAKAREGVYSDYSIRFVPPKLLEKYFTKTPDGKYRISQRVKSLVQFRLMSLTDERQMRTIGNRVDIAMCRNVLIYFDTESRAKAIRLIVENLNPGGYLFLGPSESARNVVRNLKIVLFPGAIVYVKEQAK